MCQREESSNSSVSRDATSTEALAVFVDVSETNTLLAAWRDRPEHGHYSIWGNIHIIHHSC